MYHEHSLPLPPGAGRWQGRYRAQGQAGLMRTKLMIYPKGDVPVAPVQTSLQLNVNRGYLYREYFQRPDHSPRQAVKPAMFWGCPARDQRQASRRETYLHLFQNGNQDTLFSVAYTNRPTSFRFFWHEKEFSGIPIRGHCRKQPFSPILGLSPRQCPPHAFFQPQLQFFLI